MSAAADAEDVDYRTLLTDPALIAVLCISSSAALGNYAVPVALPVIGETFSLSESGIGLVMSVFSAAVLVGIPVVSVLADLYGRRRVVLPSLLVLGLSGMATLLVTSYPVLLGLRAVQGVAFAGTIPLTATLTGDLYTGPVGSSAQGMRAGVNGLASAIAPVIAGILAVLAWQYPFLLFGLTFPAAALVYRYYPEPIDARSPGDTRTMRAEIAAYSQALRSTADHRLAVFMAGGLILFFLKGGFATFLPVFVVSGLGAPVTAAGTILGIYGGTRVLVSPFSGSIMVRLGRKRTMLAGASIAAVGMGLIPAAPGLVALGVATGIYAMGEAILNPVLNDAVAAAAAARQRASVMSGMQLLKNGALAIAPVVLGTVIGAAGFTSAFLLAATLSAGYAMAVAAWFRPQPGAAA